MAKRTQKITVSTEELKELIKQVVREELREELSDISTELSRHRRELRRQRLNSIGGVTLPGVLGILAGYGAARQKRRDYD